MNDFAPTGLLQNCHAQTLLSSTRLRRLRIYPRAKAMLNASKTVILDCGDGHQLLGEFATQAKRSKGIVTLIHGWEGNSQSSYMLSAGGTFFNAGYDVFRLNLRDHGPSHHLNKELFNSARLDEVIGAIKAIHATYPHEWQFLAGFSLGGNFALRVAAKAAEADLNIQQTIGICPVVDPAKTMLALETGWWGYEKYFVRKWQKSLQKKIRLYPELGYKDNLLKLKSLREMNKYFIPNHTQFATPEDYFKAYCIADDVLASLSSPAHIIAAQDDPIILSEDLSRLAASQYLHIETKQYGGHCGFVKNYQLDSWLDGRLLELINLCRYPSGQPGKNGAA
ncbi:alpha/beta fold hydrolase [uncultured Zhongshania sp.]|mgnify:FL=1|uniref:YheT family hydrolase n=1 Tax=uncultured Zhongshania sp. TaxID=1642288 RepID=UPI0030DBB3CF|tara:strand:- start:1192 stop:2202 length:1011 start_codon:yes stop_codon:yes gene_type:complete